MAVCLGLYVDNNIIKYAKVSKERDQIKVESFGMRFYEKLGEAINKIIEETYSQKIPISISLSEETYNYFDMFALLSKNDLQKAIKTEFESYCAEKGYNPNVFETRYAIVNDKAGKDKLKIIFVSANKIEMNKQAQQFNQYKLASISPKAMSLPNLIGDNLVGKGNALIVNIEDSTEITTIINKRIYAVDKFDEGARDILTKINLRENSYSKSYEICKNTTIYTSEGKDLQTNDSTALEDIMPTLYTIVGKVRNIINQYVDENFEKVYITGTAAMINNIDLYFQEYLGNSKCEVLKPYFIQQTKDLSIRDYQEVNTAISLALMGLNEGITGMNFKAKTFVDSLPDWLKFDVGGKTDKPANKNNPTSSFFINDLGQKLSATEISLLRTAVALFIVFIVYCAFSSLLSNQFNNKENEANDSYSNTQQQISSANADNDKIKSRTNEYKSMIASLQAANDKITDRNKTRNAIPNLLNQLMYIIPTDVQVTSIENTDGTHIVINAQSDKYEQLGYFKAKIKSDVILTNVTSTAGQKDNNVVTVKIEGDLP